jgi:hypothetical protein
MALSLAALGCRNTPAEASAEVGQSRHGLQEATAEQNFLLRAVGTKALPHMPVFVSAADFAAALAAMPPPTRTTQGAKVSQGIAVASFANDLSTLGAYSATFVPTAAVVSGSVWLVANDAKTTSSGEVIASDYDVVALDMTGTFSWHATSVGVAFGNTGLDGFGRGEADSRLRQGHPEGDKGNWQAACRLPGRQAIYERWSQWRSGIAQEQLSRATTYVPRVGC